MATVAIGQNSYVQDQRVIKLDNGQTIVAEANDSVDFEDDFDSIPLVDLTDLNSTDASKRQKIAEELFNACSKVGFFYAVNHGIPTEISDAAFEYSKKFFHEVSDEKKMEVYTGLLPDSEYQGYHPMKKYNRGNRKYNDLMEAFNFTYERELDPTSPPFFEGYVARPNIWPEVPGFKEALMNYHGECLTLSRKLIKIMAISLGLNENYFDEAVKYPNASARTLHYPVQEATEDEQNGIGAHTDFELFTLVNPGAVSGLQVLNKRGHWIKAPPIKNALIVNVADCLMRLTNDKFVSTVHRVVNTSGQQRYSIPFFFGLSSDFILNPLPTCVDEKNPAKYPVTTCKDYLEWRANVAKGKKIPLKTLDVAA